MTAGTAAELPRSAHGLIETYVRAFKEWEQVKDFTTIQLAHPGRLHLYERRLQALEQARAHLFVSQPRFSPDPLWAFIERDEYGMDTLEGSLLRSDEHLRVHFADGSIETVAITIGDGHAYARGYMVKAILVDVPLFGLRAQRVEKVEKTS